MHPQDTIEEIKKCYDDLFYKYKYKYKYKFIEKIDFFIRNIKPGIKNLISWFNIIYMDRDWDQGYLYEIIIKKLNNMEKFFGDDEKVHIEDAPIVKAEIKYAKEALERLNKEEYFTDEYKKWLDEDLPINERYSSPEFKNIFEQYINHADKMTQRDFSIFSILFKNSKTWWD